MKYKLLAIDLDDTLLNSAGELDKYSIDTIKKVIDLGIIVVLASGRMIRSVLKFHKQLNLDTPCISFGGALVSEVDGTILYASNLTSDVAHSLVKYCDSKNYHVQVYTHNDYIYKQHNEFSKFYADQLEFEGIADEEYIFNPNIVTPKLLIIELEKKRHADIQTDLSEKFPGLRIKRSRTMYLDILNQDANKGVALSFLMDYYNLNPGEVMAFGDNEIDVEMLKMAGMGVCVANGIECAKQAADYITDTNDNLGVAKAIEKFILEAVD